MYLDTGISASGAGATQSNFAVWEFDDTAYDTVQQPNTPAPVTVYEDVDTNTATIGNTMGAAADFSGQLPGISTRRDSHGAVGTIDGYVDHA